MIPAKVAEMGYFGAFGVTTPLIWFTRHSLSHVSDKSDSKHPYGKNNALSKT
jgi:hypothetical protein